MLSKLKKARIFPYALSLALVLICAYPLFKVEYSTDTYHFALHNGLGGITGAMIYNGRLLIYAFARLFELMGANITGFYYISFIMTLIFLSLSIALLYGIIKNHMSNSFAFLISALTILNPMSIEYFLFIEKGFFALGIFIAVLCTKCFVLFLQGKRIYLLFAYPLLAICAFTYQPLCALFASLVLPFILIYSRDIKTIAINTLLAVSVYGFGTFCNFIVMKTFDMTLRMESGINLRNIFKLLTFGLNFAPLLLVYAFVFAILVSCILFYYKKKTGKAFTKESLASILRYSFLIVGTLCAISAPCVFSLPEHVWFTLRYAYPVGTLIGTIPILYTYKITPAEEGPRSTWLFPLVACLLTITIMLCHAFFFSRHITNDRDRQDALAIEELISEYEKETGNKITKISIYFDSSVKSGFDGTIYIPSCNVRALTRSWCDISHLSLILDRHFEKIENKSSYYEYFSNKDFNNISKSNMIFENDELHLCVY